jgi:hypothetical protein
MPVNNYKNEENQRTVELITAKSAHIEIELCERATISSWTK